MIRDQWYVILESNQLKRGKMLSVTRLGEKLLLWRDSTGKAHCLIDRCCHRGVALSAGKLIDDQVQCPFHGFEFEGGGACTLIPANSKDAKIGSGYRVPSYPVYEAHGWLWIWWGTDVHQKEATSSTDGVSKLSLNAKITEPVGTPAYFSELDDSFATSTVQDHWKTHYSRVLENQLDVVHLPFVHYNNIGRGHKTVVDGPGIAWMDETMLYTYTFNRVDDGTMPKKPSELTLPPHDRYFRLELIMPNLWQNRISPKMRIVAAFVPVDEQNTILYLRTYQKFSTLPIIRSIIGYISGKLNKYVAHQDRRVVETQVPKASRLHGGEQLIQGDLPIVEYRKKRDALMDEVTARQ